MITILEPILPELPNFRIISAQTYHSRFHQNQTRGSQCHSKLHTCTQIKVSPLTFPVHQTQLTLEVSFQRQSIGTGRTFTKRQQERGGGGARVKLPLESYRSPPTDK